MRVSVLLVILFPLILKDFGQIGDLSQQLQLV